MKFVQPEVTFENFMTADIISASAEETTSPKNTAYFDPEDGSWWTPNY